MENGQSVSPRVRGTSIGVISILLLAVTVGLAQLIAGISGNERLRSYLVFFGVAFATWTYVFFYSDGYRFKSRTTRLLLFLGLSALGFLLANMFFPLEKGMAYRVATIAVLCLPAVIELVMNRPVFRQTPP